MNKIPSKLKSKWRGSIPKIIGILVASRVVAIYIVATQKDPTKTPDWATWAVPFDHEIAGENADPMWIRWWETDEGDGRAWYVPFFKKMGVKDTKHWIPRLLQLWRNGGAGALYTTLGMDLSNLHVIKYDVDGGAVRHAYKIEDVEQVGTSDSVESTRWIDGEIKTVDGHWAPRAGATMVAYYVSTLKPTWFSKLFGKKLSWMGGWKLNYAVPDLHGVPRCKWVGSPRLKS